jgi:hypothetical protein
MVLRVEEDCAHHRDRDRGYTRGAPALFHSLSKDCTIVSSIRGIVKHAQMTGLLDPGMLHAMIHILNQVVTLYG